MAQELKKYLEYKDNGPVNSVILYDTAEAFFSGKMIAKCAM